MILPPPQSSAQPAPGSDGEGCGGGSDLLPPVDQQPVNAAVATVRMPPVVRTMGPVGMMLVILISLVEQAGVPAEFVLRTSTVSATGTTVDWVNWAPVAAYAPVFGHTAGTFRVYETQSVPDGQLLPVSVTYAPSVAFCDGSKGTVTINPDAVACCSGATRASMEIAPVDALSDVTMPLIVV